MSENTRNFDVIVIGAGSVGVPAAYFIAKAGLKVLVVDRYASVGQGANKAAIGGVRATHSDTAKIRIGLKSIEILSTWKETFGDNIEWHTGGYTFVAYKAREEEILKGLLKIQHSYGLNIDWLNRDEMLQAVPSLNAEGLVGGTLSPEDGNASPLLALHAFYRQALLHGAEFRFGESVTSIPVRNGKVAGVETDKGLYSAAVIINAAGAHAQAISRLVGLDAHTGQIVFCITPSPPIVGTDRRETSEFLPMVSRRMIEIMPGLMNLKVRRTWRGLYPMTPDGAPIVGWAGEVEGFVQAVGMCGQGFMLGPGLGDYLAKLVTGDLDESDQEVFEVLSPYRDFAAAEQLR
jgi:sarcosine oxidase subunit beta